MDSETARASKREGRTKGQKDGRCFIKKKKEEKKRSSNWKCETQSGEDAYQRLICWPLGEQERELSILNFSLVLQLLSHTISKLNNLMASAMKGETLKNRTFPFIYEKATCKWYISKIKHWQMELRNSSTITFKTVHAITWEMLSCSICCKKTTRLHL